MAKAKKLPSGSWRVQVFDRFEDVRDKDGKPVLDDKGKLKKKRIYKSFTNDDPTPKGKRDVEREAAIWAASKELIKREEPEKEKMTLGQAMDSYIALRSSVLSPSTISDIKLLF
jgi:Zn-dependent metalloprotease